MQNAKTCKVYKKDLAPVACIKKLIDNLHKFLTILIIPKTIISQQFRFVDMNFFDLLIIIFVLSISNFCH